MSYEAPASDVTRAEEMSAIADSILDDSNIVGDWNDPASLAEPGQSEFSEIEGVEPGGGDLLADFDDQPEQAEAQEQQVAPEAEQTPQELSPASVEESVQELTQAVEQYGLADETAAMRLIQEMGANASTANVQAFDRNLGGMFLSAARLVGEGASLQNLPPIHPLMAARFTSDFFRGVGIDPRAQGIDAQAFSKVALAGVVNFVSALNTFGADAPMDVLNSPDMAQMFVEALHQAVGDTNPVTREQALAEADMLGRFIQSKYQRLVANLPQAQPAKASRGSRRRSADPQQAQPRNSSRFQTNTDLFDDSTMEIYQREHGRL